MNKHLLLWIALVTFVAGLSSCSHSINAYRDGSVWFCEEITDEWPPTNYHVIYYFKGDTIISQKKYLKMYYKRLSKPEHYYCSMRTEKNKVYYVPKDRKWELLIFDYNIKPGDTIEIFSTCRGYYTDEFPTPCKMKCLGKSTMESYGYTYEIFTVARPEIYWETGKWIKGIGSIAGPIDNDYMLCFGGGSSPYEIMVDGKIVWMDSIRKEQVSKNLSK